MVPLAGHGTLTLARPASLYLHLPFCASTCAYCSFVTTTDRGLLPRYLRALQRELAMVGRGRRRPLCTLYLGGGTPSLLSGSQLERLLDAVRTHFSLVPGAEVTLEANPDDVTPEAIGLWRRLGITRVSLGVQSFSGRVLRLLSRRHSAEQAEQALAWLLAAGFVVSCDLMLGVPGLRRAELASTLEVLVRRGPHHVSVYLLEMDKPHRLAELARRRRDLFPSDEEAAQQYLLTARILGRAGYSHYEVSNWARRGFFARHNLRYWRGGVVLACGVGAYGQGRRSRWANTPNLGEYLTRVETGEIPRAWRSELTAEQAKAERVMLALRLARGARWSQAEEVATVRPDFGRVLEDFLQAGLARRRGARLRLTPRGWLVSNELFVTLV